jgi:hypothetical protein
MIEVGTVLLFEKDSLFVSSMTKSCPLGMVMRTGDQPAGFGFNDLHVDGSTFGPQL